LEIGRAGLNCDLGERQWDDVPLDELLAQAAIATPDRPFQLEALIRRGAGIDRIYDATRVDPWFLEQMAMITEERAALAEIGFAAMHRRAWRRAKRLGFADAQLAYLWSVPEADVRAARLAAGVRPTFKTVDTCAAEFAAETPYHYSTYEDENEVRASDKPRVVILGSGPNRIGQGIEFDYCCVHASFALHDAGFETVMVNCNPETVSTDYDTSDRLYFEPLTHEDVLNVIEAETEAAGGVAPKVIVSLGGQTPLKLAGLLPPGLIAGTSPRSIDLAEDREKWNELCESLQIPQPPGGTATSLAEADLIVERIGYPVLVRPSYVLGGRAMRIVDDHGALADAMQELDGFGSLGKEGGLSKERPVLVDRFLEDATEVDIDAIRDHTGEVLIGGVMEHVEEAGVHSGDSACAIPPQTLQSWVVEVMEAYTRAIANALDVRGLINVQFAVRQNQVFVIEANPRASRTVPFVAKATGVPLAKVASRVMLGATLAELRTAGVLPEPVRGGHVSVKEAVLPFNRFPEVDSALGPEMRSTGEVMGIASSFGLAFSKAETAAGTELPTSGTVFLSLADRDKPAGLIVARRLQERGLRVVATKGTAEYLARFGMAIDDDQRVSKLSDGTGTSAVDLIQSGQIDFVINTPSGSGARADGYYIRKAANLARIGSVTTVEASLALVAGMAAREATELTVCSLQEYHARPAPVAVANDPGR
jgi:carbamoyl-phosphate synthase large subunit